METLLTISNFLILGLILAVPILILIILKKKNVGHTLIIYFPASLLILAILTLVLAWWLHASDLILLKHYGYNIDGINEAGFYRNVSPENMDKVKNLEISIMGIGWPAKAIFGYITFVPYLIFVYIGKIIVDKMNKNKSADNAHQ